MKALWDCWHKLMTLLYPSLVLALGVGITIVGLTAVLFGVFELTWALDCEGRLVSEGQAPWGVREICGEPTEVHDTVEIVLQPAYDLSERVVNHLPVAVPKSVWTYNFGPSRLVYILTFREGKLTHMEIGDYGY